MYISRVAHNFYKCRQNIKSCLPLLLPKPTKRLQICSILGPSTYILNSIQKKMDRTSLNLIMSISANYAEKVDT